MPRDYWWWWWGGLVASMTLVSMASCSYAPEPNNGVLTSLGIVGWTGCAIAGYRQSRPVRATFSLWWSIVALVTTAAFALTVNLRVPEWAVNVLGVTTGIIWVVGLLVMATDWVIRTLRARRRGRAPIE